MIGDIEDLISKFTSNALDYKIPEDDVITIRSNLLDWYDKNRRKMPWRGDPVESMAEDAITFPNAYATWVSEVMLQQTRVETVIPYWIKWMKTYPTVEALSKATPDDVNKIWSGLGYYRRAQLLLEGAKTVVSKHHGELPMTVPELLQVPGIGPYTAGAIASLAHGQVAPIVDGNIVRVYSRLLAIRDTASSSNNSKICWSTAALLVDPLRPGDFNQAVMELGATVCKPTSPSCDICPIQSLCRAKILANSSNSSIKTSFPTDKNEMDGQGLPLSVTYFPRKEPKKVPKQLIFFVHVFFSPSSQVDDIASYRYLMLRRPKAGLLANQWEFPTIEEPTPIESIHMDLFKTLLREKYGIALIESIDDGIAGDLMTLMITNESTILEEVVEHEFSHQKHVMSVTVTSVQSLFERGGSIAEGVTYRESQWMTAEDIRDIATTGCKKILSAIVTKLSASESSDKKIFKKARKKL